MSSWRTEKIDGKNKLYVSITFCSTGDYLEIDRLDGMLIERLYNQIALTDYEIIFVPTIKRDYPEKETIEMFIYKVINGQNSDHIIGIGKTGKEVKFSTDNEYKKLLELLRKEPYKSDFIKRLREQSV